MTLLLEPVVWDRHQGDNDDTVMVRLDGITLLPIDTLVKGWVALGLAAPVQLTALISNALTREVTVQLGGATGWLATAAIARWRFTVTCDFADGRGPITWPERGHNIINVHGRV